MAQKERRRVNSRHEEIGADTAIAQTGLLVGPVPTGTEAEAEVDEQDYQYRQAEEGDPRVEDVVLVPARGEHGNGQLRHFISHQAAFTCGGPAYCSSGWVVLTMPLMTQVVRLAHFRCIFSHGGQGSATHPLNSA